VGRHGFTSGNAACERLAGLALSQYLVHNVPSAVAVVKLQQGEPATLELCTAALGQTCDCVLIFHPCLSFSRIISRLQCLSYLEATSTGKSDGDEWTVGTHSRELGYARTGYTHHPRTPANDSRKESQIQQCLGGHGNIVSTLFFILARPKKLPLESMDLADAQPAQVQRHLGGACPGNRLCKI
jgi:hypothetical protein